MRLLPKKARITSGSIIFDRKDLAKLKEDEVKEIRGTTSPEKIVVRSRTEEKEIPVRGVFIELGYVPNTAPFSRLVKMNREGRIIIDENNQTNVPASSLQVIQHPDPPDPQGLEKQWHSKWQQGYILIPF
jgi:hypothetical protein